MIEVETEGAQRIVRKLESLADLADRIEEDCKGAICETMRSTAVKKLQASKAVDTGRLKSSVETTSADFTERPASDIVSVGIRTRVPYAIFIEYGTGPLGDPAVPHTARERWVYYDQRKGGFRTAKTQPARPFMRPALYDNRNEFVKIISREIREVFDGN